MRKNREVCKCEEILKNLLSNRYITINTHKNNNDSLKKKGKLKKRKIKKIKKQTWNKCYRKIRNLMYEGDD